MGKRDWTDAEIERAVQYLWDIPSVWTTETVARRALDAGMPVPPDPVRGGLVAEVDKFLTRTGRAGVAQGLADAILARFEVRERGKA